MLNQWIVISFGEDTIEHDCIERWLQSVMFLVTFIKCSDFCYFGNQFSISNFDALVYVMNCELIRCIFWAKKILKNWYFQFTAFKMKNPIWKIKEDDKEYLLMYCETDTLCKLCPISYQKILEFEKDENNGWHSGPTCYYIEVIERETND